MRTSQEMLQILKGADADKRVLFDDLFEKNLSEGLSDGEIVILEALKKELIKPVSQVVDMSASMFGQGGAGG